MAKLVPCGVRKAIATGSKHPEYHGLRVSSDYPLLTAGYMQRLSFPPVFNLFKYLFDKNFSVPCNKMSNLSPRSITNIY